MRISCPSCGAEYDVPDQALATGPRLLRCARCGHSFRAALPGAAMAGAAMADSTPPAGAESRIAAPAEPAAETPATLDQTNPAAPDKPPPSEPARPPRAPPPPGAAAEDRLGQAPSSPPDRFAVAGWVMTVLVLGLAAYAGYAFRAEIMAAWPPSQRLYALLGLV